MGLFDKFKNDIRFSKSNQSTNKSFTVLTKAPTKSSQLPINITSTSISINNTTTHSNSNKNSSTHSNSNKNSSTISNQNKNQTSSTSTSTSNSTSTSTSTSTSNHATSGPNHANNSSSLPMNPTPIAQTLSLPNIPNHIPNHVRSNTSHSSSYSEFSNLGSDSSCTSSESHNYQAKKSWLKPKVVNTTIDSFISPFDDLTINGSDQLPDLVAQFDDDSNNNINTKINNNNNNSNNLKNRKPPSDLIEDFELEPVSSPLVSPKQSSFNKSATSTRSSSPYQSKRIVSPQNHARSRSPPRLNQNLVKPKSPPISQQNSTRKVFSKSSISPWKPSSDQAIAYQHDYNSTQEIDFDSESNSESSNPSLNQQNFNKRKNYLIPQQQKLPINHQQQFYYQMNHQNQYPPQQYYNPVSYSLDEYDKSSQSNNRSSGLRNDITRKSTMNSKRCYSVPSLTHPSLNNNHKRINSYDSTSKPYSMDSNEVESEDFVQNYDKDRVISSVTRSDSLYGMSDKILKRHISDYSKFLFEDAELDHDDDDEEEEDGIISKKNDLPIKPPLLRSLSAESKVSANSIQSDNSEKFRVTSAQERTERLQSLNAKMNQMNKPRSRSSEGKIRHSFQPPQQTNFQPMIPNNTGGFQRHSFMPFNNGMPLEPMGTNGGVNGGMLPYTQSMMNFNTEYAGSPYDPSNRRQSMSAGLRMRNQPQQIRDRRSMIQLGNSNMNYHSQVSIPRIHDGTINRKIEEFIDLRNIISSGNKSLVYRLKWVQMLITAVNYNLYSFINIKGEPVGSEFAMYNKQLFVKSAITHLFKLLKEGTGKKKYDSIRKEVYFIHGCLLKHDYVQLFDQDFGIEKDVVLAIEMFEKCLELNPNDYKTLYKLGEIFEFEYPEEIDKALQYYKESAQFSYNRAIYRIALLYLNCPPFRSLKFHKYLTDLANIHIDDVEVKTDDEFEEVSDVIGLAAYELGKLYEGIYPGDLSVEDEFVQQALKIAPVNYAKALTYYNKAAKVNCVSGLVKLGNIYEFGELNRQRNPNKSIQWYTKATTSPLVFKRHPEAMLGLSRWNLVGSGGSNRQIIGPNPQAAVMWCERAITEFESVDAMYFMGELSEMGFTTTDANMWYSKAYSLGHEEAGRKLGLQPEYNGQGYDQDDDEPELSENDEDEDEDQHHHHHQQQQQQQQQQHFGEDEDEINSTIIMH